MNNLYAIFIFTLEYDSLNVIIHIKYSENRRSSRVVNTCIFSCSVYLFFKYIHWLLSMEALENYKIYACSLWLYERSFHFHMEENDFRLGRARFWRTSIYNITSKLYYICICCFFRNKIPYELRFIY